MAFLGGFFSKDKIRKRWSKIGGYIWSHRNQIAKAVIDVAAEKIKDNSSPKGDEIVDKVKSELDKVLPLLAICLLPLTGFGCATIATVEDLPQRDLVAIGDSVTAGVGAGGVVDLTDPFSSVDRKSAFPYLITKELKLKHANLAVPGAMADDVRRLQVIPALALRPKIIILFIGGNDLVHGRSVETFSAGIHEISKLLSESKARVYVLNLPDVWSAPRFQEKPDDDVTEARVLAFNEATKLATQKYSIKLIDISGPELAEADLFGNDKFHPNGKWHSLVAERILSQIRYGIYR